LHDSCSHLRKNMKNKKLYEMKTKKNNRTSFSKTKVKILQNNLMKRFIFDIQREDPLDAQMLEIIPVFVPVKVR